MKGSRTRPALLNGQRRFALPELISGHSHGQRFLSPYNGLSGVRVEVGTFGRRNTCRLALHLRSNPGAGVDLRTLEIPMHMLKDGQPIVFRFEPLEDSENRWLYFVAELPDGAPGDAVTLWAAFDSSPEPKGQRYEDGLPAEGSLVFSLEFSKPNKSAILGT